MRRKRYWHFITLVKVLAIVVIAVCAMTYFFGFVSVLFNALAAGYLAAGIVACIGVYAIIATIRNDIARNRNSEEVK